MFTLEWSDTEQCVAQEWIQRDSLTGRVGRRCRCCPFLCYKRTCVMCLYVVFTFATIVILGFLIAMLVGVAIPYWNTLDYVQTTCVTSRSTYNESQPKRCSCGKRCHSSYPCLHVYVRYRTLGGATESATLYDSEYASSCSYEPQCGVGPSSNREKVKEYRNTYGNMGNNFTCFYDQGGSGHVIRTRYSNEALTLHLLLWPSLLICGTVLGFIVTSLTCGYRYIWLVKPPEEIKQEARMRVPESYRFRADASYSRLNGTSIG